MKKKVVKEESKGIDTTELIAAMDELEKNNGIKKDFLMESIETALVSAYKKNYDSNDENIKVVIDKVDGQMHVFQEKTVVSFDDFNDFDKEITIEDALEMNKNYKIGDIVQFELMPKELW